MPNLKTTLTRPNVRIYRVYEKEKLGVGTRTSQLMDKWPSPKFIVPWSDFNLDVLESLFKRHLSQKLSETIIEFGSQEYSTDIDETIDQEEHICSIFDKKNGAILQYVLDASSQELVQQSLKLSKGAGKLAWAGMDSSKTDFYTTSSLHDKWCILPGEVKCCWKFGSVTMSSCLGDDGHLPSQQSSRKEMRPLRQLLHYCVLSDARFGYLVTDMELVVIRLSCLEKREFLSNQRKRMKTYIKDNLVVEYKSIPWQQSAKIESPLTVNLALWYLHMLAANNGRLQPEPAPLLIHEPRIDQEHRIRLSTEWVEIVSKKDNKLDLQPMPVLYDDEKKDKERRAAQKVLPSGRDPNSPIFSNASCAVGQKDHQRSTNSGQKAIQSSGNSVRQAIQRSREDVEDVILKPRNTNHRISKRPTNSISKSRH